MVGVRGGNRKQMHVAGVRVVLVSRPLRLKLCYGMISLRWLSTTADDCSLNEVEAVPAPRGQKHYRVKRGAFSRVPAIADPQVIITKALKVGERATISKNSKQGKSFKMLHILKNAKRVEGLGSSIITRLEGYLENFPERHQLHPYELELIELTISASLKHVPG